MRWRPVAVGVAGALALLVVLEWFAVHRKPEAALKWPDPLKAPQARALLQSECRAAAVEGKPLLVEFSAPWCEHCQAVKQTMRDPELAELLSPFRTLVLNIGSDDALDDVRRELEARAIPAWVVVRPDRCNAEPKSWQRLANTYPRGDARLLRKFLRRFGAAG